MGINNANNMGNTPLHIAAMSGSEDVAVLLAENGGFLGIANRTGFTRTRLYLPFCSKTITINNTFV